MEKNHQTIMNSSEIKKVARLLEYEDNLRIVRKDFLENGVKFFDKKGWGYIVDGTKHYRG
jgi:hypothetical protein